MDVLVYDPVDQKQFRRSEAYAEKDGLFFGSLETQQMYYRFIDKGFEVVMVENKPMLRQRKPVVLWKDTMRVRKENKDKEIPALKAGRYTLTGTVPSNSSLKKFSAKFKVLHKDGRTVLAEGEFHFDKKHDSRSDRFRIDDDADAPSLHIEVSGFHMFSKALVDWVLEFVPMSTDRQEVAIARNMTKTIARKDEFLVELEKGTTGVGMTLGWDKNLKAVLVRSVEENGAAARTKLLRVGDRIVGIQGKRIDGMSFKKVIKVLRNIPIVVILLITRTSSGMAGGPPASAPPPLGNHRIRHINEARPPRPPRSNKLAPKVEARRGYVETSSGRPAPPPRPSRPKDKSESVAHIPYSPQLQSKRPVCPPATVPARPPPYLNRKVASPPTFQRNRLSGHSAPPVPMRPHENGAHAKPRPGPPISIPSHGTEPYKPVPAVRRQEVDSYGAQHPTRKPQSDQPTGEPNVGMSRPPRPPPMTQKPGVLPPPVTVQDGKYAKYEKMRKSGIPEGAIRHAFARDGIEPPAGFFDSPSGATEPLPSHSPPSLSAPPPVMNSMPAARPSFLTDVVSHDKNSLRPPAPPSAPPSMPQAISTGRPSFLSDIANHSKTTLRKSDDHDHPSARYVAKMPIEEEKGPSTIEDMMKDAFEKMRPAIASDSDSEDEDWNDEDQWAM